MQRLAIIVGASLLTFGTASAQVSTAPGTTINPSVAPSVAAPGTTTGTVGGTTATPGATSPGVRSTLPGVTPPIGQSGTGVTGDGRVGTLAPGNGATTPPTPQ